MPMDENRNHAAGRTETAAPPTPALTRFAREVCPFLELPPFQLTYYKVLEAFARGTVRRLIVTMPPQHGKSHGASTLLPAYILGLDPDRRIALASYSATLASRFNRRVQRLIEQPEYGSLFPDTTIKGAGRPGSYIRTSDQVEIVGHHGELFSVGREGPLTGNRVDTFILDDLYKDALEANSPVVRENCWEWYTSVVRTRLHNDSGELLVFTRWHEEDLIGLLARRERMVPLVRESQLTDTPPDTWLVLNFEAVKESPSTEIDPRPSGAPLWPERHSLRLLEEKRRLDPMRFECMYQGRPFSREGLLYGEGFRTYDRLPDELVRLANYTDTADTGDDYLCSLCYAVDAGGLIYITDAVYSREGMEVTEGLVADMINRNLTRQVLVESNNGGRGFARAVGRLTPLASVEWFHQHANKEARILSNSATVLRNIRMPADWRDRWPDLYTHLCGYRRRFRSNRWHDAPDVLTGIVERESVEEARSRIRALGFRPAGG